MITKRISIIFLSLCLAFCSIILICTSVNNKKSNVYADARTDLIEAGQARAEYMYQYRWTPTQNLGGWGTTFYAGESYTVPYSQPYYYGGYIFYNVTLAQFEEYALNGSNGFYNYHDNNGNTSACPKYGIDCSGFVSFCIGSKTRYTTYYIKEYANSNQNGFYNKTWETATRGDILNCNNSYRQHVLMIKEVNGEYITTYESTPGYRVGNMDIWVRTQTKTQWANDGYNVVGHDYTTNCGGAPKDDVTGRSLGLTIKSNTVLGSCETNNASSSWDKTSMYNTSSAHFNNRKVSISSFIGNDAIYFNQSNSTRLKVGATFTTTGKTTSELYGKFGIGFFNSAGNGLFTYVDAFGTSGTATSNITGTNVGVVAKNSNNSAQWDWKTGTNYDIATNVYSSSSPIQIEIERDGNIFDIYINGSFVKSLSGANYYLSATEKIYPCILTFNTCIEVTDYYSVATHDSIKIDGSLDDWKDLEYWSYIDANKKGIYDVNDITKGVTFYTRWTDAGLFIYAIANHDKNATGVADWWQNTNFEIIINKDDSASQYYAISTQVRGFDSFYFKTSGSSNNYVSVLEAFIADCELFDSGINIGLAFKIKDYTNHVNDIITLPDSTITPYWCAENLDPHTIPFTLTKESDIVLPEPPTSSSQSNSSIESSSSSTEPSSSSKENSSVNASSSSQESPSSSSQETISSTTSQETPSSSVVNSNNSTVTSTSNNRTNTSGCGAKLNFVYTLFPLAFIAIVIFNRKFKNQ